MEECDVEKGIGEAGEWKGNGKGVRTLQGAVREAIWKGERERERELEVEMGRGGEVFL